MELTITRTDGSTATTKVAAADLIAFERKFDTTYEAVDKTPRIEYIAFLAWNSLHRTGVETRTFDEFVDALDDFDVVTAPLAPSSDSSSE